MCQTCTASLLLVNDGDRISHCYMTAATCRAATPVHPAPAGGAACAAQRPRCNHMPGSAAAPPAQPRPTLQLSRRTPGQQTRFGADIRHKADRTAAAPQHCPPQVHASPANAAPPAGAATRPMFPVDKCTHGCAHVSGWEAVSDSVTTPFSWLQAVDVTIVNDNEDLRDAGNEVMTLINTLPLQVGLSPACCPWHCLDVPQHSAHHPVHVRSLKHG